MKKNRLIRQFTSAFLLAVLSLTSLAYGISDGEKRQRIEAMVADIEAEIVVPEIDVPTAQRLVAQEGVLFIDVREPKEILVSTIPGSISQQQFVANPSAYKNKKIIAYCTIGYRSSKFVKHWNRQGFNISNLRGSLLLWTHANGPLVDSQGIPTHQMHVYGRKWDLLPAVYQSVY